MSDAYSLCGCINLKKGINDFGSFDIRIMSEGFALSILSLFLLLEGKIQSERVTSHNPFIAHT